MRDHLSFRQSVEVPKSLCSSGVLPNILGRTGLSAMLAALLDRLPADAVFLMLEVHSTNALPRRPLGEHAPLLAHWKDLSHAEVMSYWVTTLVEEREWVLELLRSM